MVLVGSGTGEVAFNITSEAFHPDSRRGPPLMQSSVGGGLDIRCLGEDFCPSSWIAVSN